MTLSKEVFGITEEELEENAVGIPREELVKFTEYLNFMHGKGSRRELRTVTLIQVTSAVEAMLSNPNYSIPWGHGDKVDREGIYNYLYTQQELKALYDREQGNDK